MRSHRPLSPTPVDARHPPTGARQAIVRWRWKLIVCCLLLAGLDGAALLGQEEAAQRRMLEAQRLLDGGDPQAARQAFTAVADQFSTSPQAPKALLRAARISYQQLDPDGALTAAEQLMSAHGASPEAAAARVLRTRIAFDSASGSLALAEMVKELQSVVDLYPRARFPQLEARAEARALIGDLLARTGDLPQASSVYLEAIEDEPVSQHTADAAYGLAHVLARTGDRSGALELAQRALDLEVARAGDGVFTNDAEIFRTYMTLLHRHWIRPAAGQRRWQQAMSLSVSGVVLKRPRAVAVSRFGVLAISDQTGAFLVDQQGAGQLVGDPKNLGRPFFDDRGRPYFPSSEGVLQPLGRGNINFTAGSDKPKPLARLVAGARGDLGEWVVIDRSSDEPSAFDSSGRWRGPLATNSEALDIASAPWGGAFVLTEGKPGRVLGFDRDHRLAGGFGGQWQRASAVAVDALSQVYVLDGSTATINVFSDNGDPIVTVGPTLPNGLQLRAPEDLAVDGSGRLFVVDSKAGGIIIIQ